MKCEICGKDCKSYASLGRHLKDIHKIKTQTYYDTYYRKPNEGYCLTCGKETSFRGFNGGGYAPYCSLKCANSNKDKCAKTVQKIRDNHNGNWITIPEESIKAGNIKRHKTMVSKFGENYSSILAEKGKEKQKQTKANWSDEKKKEVIQKRKKTNIEKYGVENVLLLDENKEKANQHKHSKEADEKRKRTCKKHYGTEYHFQAKEVQDKIKQTNLEHFGVECVLQSEEVREKIKQTSLERYGTTNPHSFGSEQFIQDMIDKYGVENCMQIPEIKEKMQQTYIENNGGLWGASESVQEQMKKTSLEKYGTERPQQSDEVQNKIKQTNVDRYGVENVFSSDIHKQKIKETMLDRYGVENIQQLKETKKKSKQTFDKNKKLDSEINDADE